MKNLKMLWIPALILGFLFFQPQGIVNAQSNGSEEQPPVEPTQTSPNQDHPVIRERTNNFLSRAYQAAGNFKSHVEKDLERTEEIEERILDVIERLEETGKDSSALETALATYLSTVESLKPGFEEGIAIYSLHEGMDGEGQVVDAKLAGEMIKEVKAAFQTTHRSWHEATKILRDLLRTYQQEIPTPL